MSHSTRGLPVHHQLPEFTQTHVHRVGDAIQLSHPLSSASPPALNFSQHQGLFQRDGSSHQVAKLLDLQPYVLYIYQVAINLCYYCMEAMCMCVYVSVMEGVMYLYFFF